MLFIAGTARRFSHSLPHYSVRCAHNRYKHLPKKITAIAPQPMGYCHFIYFYLFKETIAHYHRKATQTHYSIYLSRNILPL